MPKIARTTGKLLQVRSRQGNPRDTRAFLQDCSQTFGDPLVVSSGTHQKISETLVCFFRNAPKHSRDTRAFLQERTNKIGETLPRFFWNAQKISVRHSCVSSATRPQNQRDTRAFLQERAKETVTHSRVSSGTRQKYLQVTRVFLQERVQKISEVSSGTPKKTEKSSRVSSGTHQNNRRVTRAFLQERAKTIRETLVRFFRNILNDFTKTNFQPKAELKAYKTIEFKPESKTGSADMFCCP